MRAPSTQRPHSIPIRAGWESTAGAVLRSHVSPGTQGAHFESEVCSERSLHASGRGPTILHGARLSVPAQRTTGHAAIALCRPARAASNRRASEGTYEYDGTDLDQQGRSTAGQ